MPEKKKIKKSFILKDKLPQLKGFLKEALWFSGKHAFWVILISFFLSIAFGGFLFYNCIIRVKNLQPEIDENRSIFREDIYQEVVKRWDSENEEDGESQELDYSNPFIAE